MAGFLHARQAGDLALGKPPLRRFPKSASVGDALRALKKCNEVDLSLWEELCRLTQKPIAAPKPVSHGDDPPLLQGREKERLWRCVGKVGMLDIICFLARDESLADVGAALKSPVASIVPDSAFAVQHVDSQTKLFDALGQVLDGVQNLVVSIDRSVSSRLARYNSMPNPWKGTGAQLITTKPKGELNPDLRQFSLPPISKEGGPTGTEPGAQEYCWLTPEDVVRFLLSCIGLFSPLPMMTIQQLGIINADVLTVDAAADAAAALPLIRKAAAEMTAVAVVEDDDEGEEVKLVGEISAFTMKGCDETAALALATLSMRQFLSFTQDCGGPPAALVERVQLRLRQKFDAARPSDGGGPPIPSPIPPSVTESGPGRGLASLCGLDSGDEESSDEDSAAAAGHSPTGPLGFAHDPSARLYRAPTLSKGRTAPNTCRPWSSLVAVMAQALTHRVGYIWVTDDDNSLLGIVTYLDIINCILSHLYSSD